MRAFCYSHPGPASDIHRAHRSPQRPEVSLTTYLRFPLELCQQARSAHVKPCQRPAYFSASIGNHLSMCMAAVAAGLVLPKISVPVL